MGTAYWLEDFSTDVGVVICSIFDDPNDLIRLAAVSHAWKHFVTSNGFVKNLFLKKADLADTAGVCFEYNKESTAYALLIRAMEYAKLFDLTIEAVLASSTLSPDFSIQNTLLSMESRQWSSKGREVQSGTETLTYNMPELYVSLPGSPTFRAQRVRFFFGSNDGTGFKENYSTETYQIPSSGQLEVRLPMPLLCINKQMVLELSDFVDKHPFEAQYYIRVSRVQILGVSLADMFRTRISPSGQLVLDAISYLDPKIKRDLN
ncbi:F-box protein At4g00755-like [Eutrema salsugineum]|uniref:F-box protein At4g00755-like n=1 Tax=Eutrema salsugineum TaxID=72664 RepID=UPI000CED362D|nr:F-box protein At4g00755-like [Eutrema salsugineum]